MKAQGRGDEDIVEGGGTGKWRLLFKLMSPEFLYIIFSQIALFPCYIV